MGIDAVKEVPEAVLELQGTSVPFIMMAVVLSELEYSPSFCFN
jgi:hypothetical protein